MARKGEGRRLWTHLLIECARVLGREVRLRIARQNRVAVFSPQGKVHMMVRRDQGRHCYVKQALASRWPDLPVLPRRPRGGSSAHSRVAGRHASGFACKSRCENGTSRDCMSTLNPMQALLCALAALVTRRLLTCVGTPPSQAPCPTWQGAVAGQEVTLYQIRG